MAKGRKKINKEVKVKFVLEQTIQTQRGNSGVVLLFP
jgi:hypothetical protein